MHRKQLVSTYRDLAGWYDAHYYAHGTWPTSLTYAQTILELLRQCGMPATQRLRLLDIACGGGFFLHYVQAEFALACGCDLSRVALAEAHARNAALQLARANGEALPYTAASFDVVTCLGSLEHFLQPEPALAEIRRVLMPDGLALILVPTNPDWAIYDIQPTEIVLDAAGWSAMLARQGLTPIYSLATDDSEALRAASGGCQVLLARPATPHEASDDR